MARASAALAGVDAADDAARLGAQAALRAALAPTYAGPVNRMLPLGDGHVVYGTVEPTSSAADAVTLIVPTSATRALKDALRTVAFLAEI